jgi:hypothetical protein
MAQAIRRIRVSAPAEVFQMKNPLITLQNHFSIGSTHGGVMSSNARRFRSLIVTIVAIAATNAAISFASGVPTKPMNPRPKDSGVPTSPENPRPRTSGVPTTPNNPRP